MDGRIFEDIALSLFGRGRQGLAFDGRDLRLGRGIPVQSGLGCRRSRFQGSFGHGASENGNEGWEAIKIRRWQGRGLAPISANLVDP